MPPNINHEPSPLPLASSSIPARSLAATFSARRRRSWESNLTPSNATLQRNKALLMDYNGIMLVANGFRRFQVANGSYWYFWYTDHGG